MTFNGITFDPAGVQDPTGQPLHSYGAGGAYGISNGQSDSSGYTNDNLISLANRHDAYQGDAVTNPVWSNNTLVAGARCNFAC